MIVIVPFTELTEDQRTQIESAPDFLEFVESSSKIVQRAENPGAELQRLFFPERGVAVSGSTLD